MARVSKFDRASPKDTKGARPDNWLNFVRPDLTDAEKADCKKWSMWDEKSGDMLAHLCDDQLRLSIKKDFNSGGYVVFLQPVNPGHRYDGWCLTGRGSDPQKALKQVCFRHFVQFDEEWPMVEANQIIEDWND